MTDTDKRLEEIRRLESELSNQGKHLAPQGRGSLNLFTDAADAISELLETIDTLRAEAKAARQGLPPDCDLLRDIAKEERRKALEEAASWVDSLTKRDAWCFDEIPVASTMNIMVRLAKKIRALPPEGK